jgi:hypothetical protein
MLRELAIAFVVGFLTLCTGCESPKPSTVADHLEPRAVFLGWDELDTGRPIMRLADQSSGSRYSLHVPESTETMIDGQASKLGQLKQGMAVVLTVRDKTVIRVQAFSGQ